MSLPRSSSSLFNPRISRQLVFVKVQRISISTPNIASAGRIQDMSQLFPAEAQRIVCFSRSLFFCATMAAASCRLISKYVTSSVRVKRVPRMLTTDAELKSGRAPVSIIEQHEDGHIDDNGTGYNKALLFAEQKEHHRRAAQDQIRI